jgi:hypothetical protein
VPTSTTYLSLAEAFEAAAVEVDRSLARPTTLVSPAVLAGGLLTAQVTDALAANSARVTSAARALRDAAHECRRRAAVCALHAHRVAVWDAEDAAYGRALRDWQAADAAHRASSSVPAPGPRPLPPTPRPERPAPWVG